MQLSTLRSLGYRHRRPRGVLGWVSLCSSFDGNQKQNAVVPPTTIGWSSGGDEHQPVSFLCDVSGDVVLYPEERDDVIYRLR